MPNIAAVLKSEIARVSRKEVRGETQALRKAVTAYRSEIAALKRRTQSLEQQIRSLAKASAQAGSHGAGGGAAAAGAPEKARRFSAKGLATQRRRLGLSAEDLGRLIGTSGQSVYNWEQGKARPRAVHQQAIAALKTLKKAAAAAHLEAAAGKPG